MEGVVRALLEVAPEVAALFSLHAGGWMAAARINRWARCRSLRVNK